VHNPQRDPQRDGNRSAYIWPCVMWGCSRCLMQCLLQEVRLMADVKQGVGMTTWSPRAGSKQTNGFRSTFVSERCMARSSGPGVGGTLRASCIVHEGWRIPNAPKCGDGAAILGSQWAGDADKVSPKQSSHCLSAAFDCSWPDLGRWVVLPSALGT
jgi:hypothetical protein